MAEESIEKSMAGIRNHTDLLFSFIFTISGFLCTLILKDGNIIRILLSLPLLMFFPGYSLVSVLWPKSRITGDDNKEGEKEDNVQYLERLVLSLGLSMVIVSIIGLLLHFTNIGITFFSTLVPITLITVSLIFFAFHRRSKLPFDEVFHFQCDFSASAWKDGKWLTIAICICLVLAGISLAYAITTPNIESRYSSLYLLDENMTTTHYPSNLTTSNEAVVIVGLICHEFSSTEYTISIGISGADTNITANNWTRTYILDNSSLYMRSLVLDHGDEFQDRFTFNIPQPGTYKMVCTLLVNGKPSEYTVHLWINVV